MCVVEGSLCTGTQCYSNTQRLMVWMLWTQPLMLIKVVIMTTQMRTSWNSCSKELGPSMDSGTTVPLTLPVAPTWGKWVSHCEGPSSVSAASIKAKRTFTKEMQGKRNGIWRDYFTNSTLACSTWGPAQGICLLQHQRTQCCPWALLATWSSCAAGNHCSDSTQPGRFSPFGDSLAPRTLHTSSSHRARCCFSPSPGTVDHSDFSFPLFN